MLNGSRHCALGSLLFCHLALTANPASATFSVIAVDSSRGAVGGAVASCVGSLDLAQAVWLDPKRGALVAQAQLYRGPGPSPLERGVETLESGASAQQILQAMLAGDSGASQRQHGVVLFAPEGDTAEAAAHTGTDTLAYSGHRPGSTESIAFSAQGNLLSGPEVLQHLNDAMIEPACDLAEQLVNALVTVSHAGTGDKRCLPRGISSDSAHITVVAPHYSLALSVTASGTKDAVGQLQERFDAWRTTVPCAQEEQWQQEVPLGAPTAGIAPTAPRPLEGVSPNANSMQEEGDPSEGFTSSCGATPSTPPQPLWWTTVLGLVGLLLRRHSQTV